MKLLIVLMVILILPGVSYGQNVGGEVRWNIDISTPIRGGQVEVDFGRKLWNSVGLLVAPKVVKRSWPLYAYDLQTMEGADPCREGSPFGDITVGHDVALVSALHTDGIPDFSGWKLRIRSNDGADGVDSGTRAMLRYNDLCNAFLHSNLERFQHTLDGLLALQSWMQQSNSDSQTPRRLTPLNQDYRNHLAASDWVLLMEGTITQGDPDIRGIYHDPVWNVPAGEQSIHLKWDGAQPLGPDLDSIPKKIWRMETSDELDGNLFVTSTSHHEMYEARKFAAIELPNGDTADWPGFSASPNHRFEIWYRQPDSHRSFDDMSWYLVSDEPVPGVTSDLRIDKEAFASRGFPG